MDTCSIQTFSGRRFYPLDPKLEDIDIEDIAHHLSHLCRFTGAVRTFYSVAQHSVLVSQVCPPYVPAMWGLLHDASEAYLNDLSRPLKNSAGLEGYRVHEARLQRAICERFWLPTDMPAAVHEADMRMFATEARDLMAPLPDGWADHLRDPAQCYAFQIHPVRPEVAKRQFLALFRQLDGLRRGKLES